MILVLAHHHDVEAEWLLATLQRRAIAALRLCPEALGVDYAITLALRNDGRHASEIVFFDDAVGRVASGCFDYAVNRLGYIDPLVWRRAQEGERAYASSEINAFFPALIEALPCRVDSPVAHGALWVDGGFASRWAARLGARGVAVHAAVAAGAAEAWAVLMASEPACLRRWLWFEGEVLVPPGQPAVAVDMPRILRTLAPRQALEFVCLQGARASEPQLLHVSRTPALSCYGEPFVQALVSQVQGASDGHPDGHPERAALAAAV